MSRTVITLLSYTWPKDKELVTCSHCKKEARVHERPGHFLLLLSHLAINELLSADPQTISY